MATTTITKQKLIRYILDKLSASEQARRHFDVGPGAQMENSLKSIAKPELVAFVHTLGQEATKGLEALASQFPLYRPATFYLAVVDKRYELARVTSKSHQLATVGRRDVQIGEGLETIRNLYTPDPAKKLNVSGETVVELNLHYERRVDLVCNDSDSEQFGNLVSAYSLETAFVWLPNSKGHQHAVIACCDFPAVRRILGYMSAHYEMRLTLPNLDTATLNDIAGGATARSATYRRLVSSTDPDEVQTFTISDPALQMKNPFLQAKSDSEREQTAGFYINHPELALGGVGVARRDGKIWTPKRLDRKSLAGLAMGLIKRTEKRLDSFKVDNNLEALIKHYYGSSAQVGGVQLTGRQLNLWRMLAVKVIEAHDNPALESNIPGDMLVSLAKYSSKLALAPAIYGECDTCGVNELLRCSLCNNLLEVKYNAGNLVVLCAHCEEVDLDTLTCDCGAQIPVVDLKATIRLIPQQALVESFSRVYETLGRPRQLGLFIVAGTRVKHIVHKAPKLDLVSVSKLQAWKAGGIPSTVKWYPDEKRSKLIRTLNKTKEKCRREWDRPTKQDCSTCTAHPLKPEWIRDGDTCIARVLGSVIGQPFDGIHHAHEVADIKYSDKVVVDRNNNIEVAIGIHLKSRVARPPTQGLGRSTLPVKGLYTQLVFSAYLTQERQGKPFDVLGVGVPNDLHQETLASLQFAANQLGCSFLAIQEGEWLSIIDRALELAEIDNLTRPAPPANMKKRSRRQGRQPK